MLICHHIIKETEITGIGPLMKETAADQISMQVYDSVRFFFMLHLKNQSVRIESNMVARQGLSADQLQANKKHLDKFTADYDEATRQIKSLIENS